MSVVVDAQVRFDPDVVGVRTLLRLIDHDLGYPARLEDENEGDNGGEDPAERDRRFWLRRFCWAALFAVPTFLLAMVSASSQGTPVTSCFAHRHVSPVRRVPAGLSIADWPASANHFADFPVVSQDGAPLYRSRVLSACLNTWLKPRRRMAGPPSSSRESCFNVLAATDTTYWD